jgi:hypothetical protein
MSDDVNKIKDLLAKLMEVRLFNGVEALRDHFMFLNAGHPQAPREQWYFRAVERCQTPLLSNTNEDERIECKEAVPLGICATLEIRLFGEGDGIPCTHLFLHHHSFRF